MTDLFCLHCNPPAKGQHEVKCPHFKMPPEAEEILEKIDNIYERFAKITGIPLEIVMEQANEGVVEKFVANAEKGRANNGND